MKGESLFGGTETGASAGTYALVVVERAIEGRAGDSGLTYRCEEGTRVGERVVVPLGRGGKPAGGVVVRVGVDAAAEGLDESRVKAVTRRTGARVPEDLLELARWIAGYYVAPLGTVLASMTPAAVKHGTGTRSVEFLSIAPGATARGGEGLKPAARRAWERVKELHAAALPAPVRDVAAMVEIKSARALRDLVEAGLLTAARRTVVEARELPGAPAHGGTDTEGPSLSPEQASVVDRIGAGLGSFGVTLLHGVTGSGKTEVYLRLIGEVLGRGGGAIVLVPEIALTPQTAGRFTARFGAERVAVLHSGLTASQRHREWTRAATGAARVVVGARSAVFAPVAGLALIVVDEEHDGSYKQDQSPRYHARDVAVKRAQLAGCPVVLGSATPSLESWSNAAGGRYGLAVLSRRVAGRMPRVEIVDMREEGRARRRAGDGGRYYLLGPTLERALWETVSGGGQAILLLNRRGFAHRLCCVNGLCGFVVSCDHCDANLVLHRHGAAPGGEVVRCHHCLEEQRVPRACPACGGRLGVMGGGTQRLEAELDRTYGAGFGEGWYVRVDGDTMRSGADYFRTLERFGRGEARVLLGTQMIAKGLDFPNVRLVGVVDADTALSLPDFRASERTYQLVNQVAGRAGRGEAPGRVIVQTYCPEDGAIVGAAGGDFAGFARTELESRARAGLPPATRMARVVCRDASAEKARERAAGIASVLRAGIGGGGDARVEGPFECPVARVAGQHRFGVDLIGSRAGRVQALLGEARAQGWIVSDARTAVDVDPVALM